MGKSLGKLTPRLSIRVSHKHGGLATFFYTRNGRFASCVLPLIALSFSLQLPVITVDPMMNNSNNNSISESLFAFCDLSADRDPLSQVLPLCENFARRCGVRDDTSLSSIEPASLCMSLLLPGVFIWIVRSIFGLTSTTVAITRAIQAVFVLMMALGAIAAHSGAGTGWLWVYQSGIIMFRISMVAHVLAWEMERLIDGVQIIVVFAALAAAIASMMEINTSKTPWPLSVGGHLNLLLIYALLSYHWSKRWVPALLLCFFVCLSWFSLINLNYFLQVQTEADECANTDFSSVRAEGHSLLSPPSSLRQIQQGADIIRSVGRVEHKECQPPIDLHTTRQVKALIEDVCDLRLVSHDVANNFVHQTGKCYQCNDSQATTLISCSY